MLLLKGEANLNAVLVATEVVDFILRSNRGALLCKPDIEKAYDYVNCSFLCSVMERMSLEGSG